MKKRMVFLTIVLFCVCGCAPTNGNSANMYLEPTKEHSFDSSLAYDFKVDTEATKSYYQQLSDTDICDCAYCRNYIREIRLAYPQLSDYLHKLGIEIEKPFELMPLEEDAEGYIDYIGEQYIVMGDKVGFTDTAINDVQITIADSHPATNIEDAHFVIEISPIRLRWKRNEGV